MIDLVGAKTAIGFALAIAMLEGCAASAALPGGSYAVTQQRGNLVTTVLSFDGSDGATPSGAMIAANGELYGVTQAGGAAGYGALYALSPSGSETVIHSFGSAKYGADGKTPVCSPLMIDGVLYGTTRSGGANDNGAVFAIKTDGKDVWTYSFAAVGHGDGEDPQGGLIEYRGAFYGVTSYGGSPGWGTFYKVTRQGKESVILSFGDFGSRHFSAEIPVGSLLEYDGAMYGVSQYGGSTSNQNGTVFSVTPSGKYSVLYAFNGYPDGASPNGGLVLLNGRFYGTTNTGGEYNAGTIFSVTTAGKERIVHSFGGPDDGAFPDAAPIVYDGEFFGTTASGGARYSGTIYEMTPSGAEHVIASFGERRRGKTPETALVPMNSSLYGTTDAGPGINANGSVFAFTPK